MIEFLAVTILTVVCLLAVVQMAVWVWARNVAVSAVHEGARTAAETGRPLDDGVARDRDRCLHGRARRRAAVGSTSRSPQEGDTVAVRARGTAPMIVPFLPAFDVEVAGHRVRRGRGAAVTDRGSGGSAIVEFAVLGTLIFGVLVQAVVLFGVLHRATLATSAAAREYGRAVVVADSDGRGRGPGCAGGRAGRPRNHGLAAGSLARDRRRSAGAGRAAARPGADRRARVPDPVRRRGLAVGLRPGRGDARRAARPLPQRFVTRSRGRVPVRRRSSSSARC